MFLTWAVSLLTSHRPILKPATPRTCTPPPARLPFVLVTGQDIEVLRDVGAGLQEGGAENTLMLIEFLYANDMQIQLIFLSSAPLEPRNDLSMCSGPKRGPERELERGKGKKESLRALADTPPPDSTDPWAKDSRQGSPGRLEGAADSGHRARAGMGRGGGSVRCVLSFRDRCCVPSPGLCEDCGSPPPSTCAEPVPLRAIISYNCS